MTQNTEKISLKKQFSINQEALGNVNVKVNNFDVRLKRIQNQNHFLIAGLLLKIHIKQQAQ